MKEKFLYSIIIVTYNRLELLKECIDHAVKQTIQPQKIIIIDNCSTDGTKEFLLNNYYDNSLFEIIHETENIGGAGGFEKGLRIAMEHKSDWFMLIDDDAILNNECMYYMKPKIDSNRVLSYACTVVNKGEIDISHRRNDNVPVSLELYQDKEFRCNSATFCGLMINRKLVEKIGYPLKEYFIWYDDTEYCIRIIKHSPIIVRSQAILNHKTLENNGENHLSWKSYYGTRNSIDCYIRHRKWICLCKLLRHKIRFVLNVLWAQENDSKNRKYMSSIYIDAIKDGICRKLGKNPKYLPGVKK